MVVVPVEMMVSFFPRWILQLFSVQAAPEYTKWMEGQTIL